MHRWERFSSGDHTTLTLHSLQVYHWHISKIAFFAQLPMRYKDLDIIDIKKSRSSRGTPRVTTFAGSVRKWPKVRVFTILAVNFEKKCIKSRKKVTKERNM